MLKLFDRHFLLFLINFIFYFFQKYFCWIFQLIVSVFVCSNGTEKASFPFDKIGGADWKSTVFHFLRLFSLFVSLPLPLPHDQLPSACNLRLIQQFNGRLWTRGNTNSCRSCRFLVVVPFIFLFSSFSLSALFSRPMFSQAKLFCCRVYLVFDELDLFLKRQGIISPIEKKHERRIEYICWRFISRSGWFPLLKMNHY